MNKKSLKILRAFTLIELMVSIFVTLAAVGTFFKLYTNSMKAQRSTNIRSSVSLLGDQMMDQIANSIRFVGLNSVYSDFDTKKIIPSYIGGDGSDSVIFEFYSPYGGPMAKLYADASGTAACSFTIEADTTAAFYKGISTVNLMSNIGIYKGTVGSFSESSGFIQIGTSSLTDAAGTILSTDCATAFPAGTLITGPNNDYQLLYSNGGSSTNVRLFNKTTGEYIIDFQSDTDSAYQIPFFVLQFQDSDQMWVTKPTDIEKIKAVRVGFVIVSNIDRTKKAVSTAGMSTTVKYCPFDDSHCYSLNDINKTAYVFRRVIYMRNVDYIKMISTSSSGG